MLSISGGSIAFMLLLSLLGAQVSAFTQSSFPGLQVGPDAGDVNVDVMSVAATGLQVSLSVPIQLTHTFMGDLAITLQHPSSFLFLLFNQDCGASFWPSPFTFIDGGGNSCSGPTWAPNTALSTTNGLSITGSWTMTITDNFFGDSGTWSSWTLNIVTTGGGGGDPEIIGFDGRMVRMKDDSKIASRMDNQVVNLLSDSHVQLNAKIGSSIANERHHKQFVRNEEHMNKCCLQSEPDFFFHSMGLSVHKRVEVSDSDSVLHRLLLVVDTKSEEFEDRFFTESNQSEIPEPVFSLRGETNGVRVREMVSGEHVEFDGYGSIHLYDRNTPGFDELNIMENSPFDNEHITHWLTVAPEDIEEEYRITFVMSEFSYPVREQEVEAGYRQWVEFPNGNLVLHSVTEQEQGQDRFWVTRRIDVYLSSTLDREPHGYIGQSHSNTIARRSEREREKVLEGSHHDYVVKSGDLFGKDFRFNKFEHSIEFDY